MSALTGRYANRIGHGVTIEGKHYDLAPNANGVTLHGGPPPYSRRILSTVGTFQPCRRCRRHVPAGVARRRPGLSRRGDLGPHLYPDRQQRLQDGIQGDHRQDHGGELHQPHLLQSGGQWSGNVENQVMTLFADQVTPTDPYQVPTGEFTNVAGTPFDFRTPTPIGKNIRSADPQMLIGRGYDHNYVLRKSRPGALELAARITDPVSGRTLELLHHRAGGAGLFLQQSEWRDCQRGGHHLAGDGRAWRWRPSIIPTVPTSRTSRPPCCGRARPSRRRR